MNPGDLSHEFANLAEIAARMFENLQRTDPLAAAAVIQASNAAIKGKNYAARAQRILDAKTKKGAA